MPSLQGVLARIPGLAGYASGQEEDRIAAQAAQAQQMGQLQQMGALQGILAKQQKAQQQQELKGVLSRVAQQAGGDPAKMGPLLLQTGHPELMQLGQRMLPKAAEGFTLAPGAQRFGPDGKVIAQVAAKPDKQPEIIQMTELFNTLPEGDPRKAILKKAIDAKTFGREEAIRLAASLRPAPQAPQPRNLQLTTDANGNQLIVNADGTTRPLTAEDGSGVKKSVAADKPMTEFQGKAALYGTRSAQSDKILKALEDKISTAGLAAGQVTGVLGNALMSSEQQRVNQAQRDFVNAVLRQESGAVISDAEFENAKKQYFPQPGDSPQAVNQKRANRQLAIQGFARMSGPKGTADIKAIIDEPLLPGVSATDKTPQQATGKIGAAGGYVETRKTADGRTLGKKADGTIEEVK